MAEQLIATVNRDAASWQEVTRDEHTKLSGDLNVRSLAAFSTNVKAIADYSRARSAAIPDSIAAQGPRAIDTWRKMIINGASVEEATAASGSDLFQSTVAMLQGYDDAVAAYGGPGRVPLEVRQLIALGQTILFGEASNYAGGSVVVPCSTFGTCQVELDTYLHALNANPNAVDMVIAEAADTLAAFLEAGRSDQLDTNTGGRLRVQQAFLQIIMCVEVDPVGAAEDLVAAYRANPAGFAALANGNLIYNPTTILNAVESYASSGDVDVFAVGMELAKYPPLVDPREIASLIELGYELSPISDVVGVVQSVKNGDVIGVVIHGVGF